MPLYVPRYTIGGADVAVADGGTGASTAPAARTNLGLAGTPIIVPPGSTITTAPAVWFAAEWAIFNRVQLTVPTTVRYMNFRISVASGNIQVGIGSVAANGNNAQIAFTRIAHSGVIACPSAADIHLDLGGAIDLSAGDYALFFWADNTTVSTCHGSTTIGVQPSRMQFNVNAAGGVGTSATPTTTSRWVAGLTLEVA